MRKIDKTKILSTEYKKQEEKDEKSGKHSKYDSRKNKYIDVVMNLLHCQKGLCAYTEIQLCSEEFYDKANWENGRYKNRKEKPYNGQLEHFDSSLKKNKGWLWDNFFMVDSDTNNRKSNKEVDYILKPDSENYDEFALFDYNLKTHLFIAKLSLPENKRKRINGMIEVLGINFSNIVAKRRHKIEKAVRFGSEKYEVEFPTAFAFYEENMENN